MNEVKEAVGEMVKELLTTAKAPEAVMVEAAKIAISTVDNETELHDVREMIAMIHGGDLPAWWQTEIVDAKVVEEAQVRWATMASLAGLGGL